MISKESIKQVVSNGITIQFPYKSSISSWYGEVKLYKLDDFYICNCPNHIKFYNVDDAVNHFCNIAFTSKNIGYIQSRLVDKKIIDKYDEDSIENPNKDIKKLFKEEGKLIDEESKSLNIIINNFPKSDESIIEFKSIIDSFDVNTIKEQLTQFDRNYSTLNPYISMSYTYDVEGSDRGFRSMINYGDFSLNRLSESKNYNKSGMTWKCLEITLKVDGDSEYYRYEINI